MLMRVRKAISLLVTATSIVSIAPVAAAEVTHVNAEEGTIYNASSKGGGVFVVDGEINGEAEAIYYVKDGKYTKLEDANPGDEIGDIYNTKYLQLANGDYYVDVTTGEITHEDIEGNLNDDVANNLRKKIKKDNDGRFAKDSYIGNIVCADTTVRGDGSGNTTMWGISGKWRQYLYKLETSKLNGEETSTIYSDEEGNYVDADYNLGKIGIYTTSAGVTINNTEDTYEMEEEGTTYEVKAEVKNSRTWDEGPEFIVRTAELTIWRKEKGSDDSTYENITDQVSFGSKNKHYEQEINDDNSVTVLQKISKAQASDDIDGIKYSKTVSTYFITDEDGHAEPLLGLGNGSGDVYTCAGARVITGGTQGYNVSVLYDYINKKTYAETINYKSRNGYNYINIDGYDETYSDAFALGCGDVWTLGDGYVKRFNDRNNEFEKLYKVDGGMTNFSPSLPTYVVVWGEDDKVYSIIAPAASSKEEKDTTTTTTISAVSAVGWNQCANGLWNYVKEDGTKATGWLNNNGTWYYLKSDGVMATGWINDNGNWYYCNASGAMLTNTTIDGYVLGSNGAWIK